MKNALISIIIVWIIIGCKTVQVKYKSQCNWHQSGKTFTKINDSLIELQTPHLGEKYLSLSIDSINQNREDELILFGSVYWPDMNSANRRKEIIGVTIQQYIMQEKLHLKLMSNLGKTDSLGNCEIRLKRGKGDIFILISKEGYNGSVEKLICIY